MFDVTPSPSSSEASSNSSPSHSSHYESSPQESPHASPPASVPSSPAGSPTPDSSPSSSGAPSPQRIPYVCPTNVPLHPLYHSHCFHNTMPPGLHYLPGVRFIASFLVPRPIHRYPSPPPLSQTPEVSVKGFLATPPLSVTSTLSSLSPSSLSPPKSPEREFAKETLPTTSASLSRVLSYSPSKPIRASTSLPRLSFKTPPPRPSTSSRSQSMIPQPPYKSLKKSVSDPNF
ncbi:unnamed protein product [Pieris brassicae]|uniref:Uncharacterized protein n=1 Tax=Pieris brassicae TaxID=7116 RepID=A0A9P0U339_PIEBR|nr:unnamed protein product [Pieris brassicae]